MAAHGDRSSDLSQIAVNANSIPDDSVDCGVRALGWCRGPSCQKYARLRTFVVVLACAGILQGACESYFRISAKQAALENSYHPLIVDWLLVSSGIFQAIFALTFAHWAFKLHPISWLAGVIMIQGVACVVAVFPSIMNFSDGISPISTSIDANICTAPSFQALQKSLTVGQSQLLTLIMLFVLQLFLGLGALAFYVIGVTYIDDNSRSIDSPAAIATVLGAKIFGLQVGSGVVLGAGSLSIGWWLGWAVLGPLILISGILLALFPKRLPKTVIHQAAQRIIEESRSRHFGSQFSTYIDDTDFGPSVKRVFGNKLLMFNLMSIMFIQAAYRNYLAQEENYLQSRFYLPYSEEDGLLQEWKARFVGYFLTPPVAAIAMLVGGLVISKMKLSGRTITGLNISFGVHLLIIYIGYIFIKCNVGPIAGIANGKLQQPYCSRQCICAPTSFLPVCPENSTVTYFSPCYAGCKRKTSINNIELYDGCSCSMDYEMHSWANIRATEGACSAAQCFGMLIAFQALSLSAAAFLGLSMIGKIIITLRCVLPQDKALALAMEVMFVGLFSYVPVHLAYDVVTRMTCIYWAPEYKRCLLRETPKHGNILNILSASLILVGVVFDILVFIFAKGLNIYNCKVTDVDYTPSLYSAVPQSDQPPNRALPTAVGGSPATIITTTAASDTPPELQRRDSKPIRPAPTPNSEITVFRNPSSVTSGSSAGENSVAAANSDVSYAQIVFPPDKRKPDDGTTSPKRMIVRADVPLHHLSSQDVRAQLGNLKSFTASAANEDIAETPLTVDTNTAGKSRAAGAEPASPIETNSDAARPLSPETDF